MLRATMRRALILPYGPVQSCGGFQLGSGLASPEVGGVAWGEVLRDADTFAGLNLLWIGCGIKNTLFESNQAFSDRLTMNGIEHTFRTTRGAHMWDLWQRYL